MTPQDIEKIVEQVRLEWVQQGSPARTESEMMTRAAQLAAEKAAESARAIIQQVEWVKHSDETVSYGLNDWSECPCCQGHEVSTIKRLMGHKKNCPLAAWLKTNSARSSTSKKGGGG